MAKIDLPLFQIPVREGDLKLYYYGSYWVIAYNQTHAVALLCFECYATPKAFEGPDFELPFEANMDEILEMNVWDETERDYSEASQPISVADYIKSCPTPRVIEHDV